MDRSLARIVPDSAVPADAMSEEQTFRSEVNGCYLRRVQFVQKVQMVQNVLNGLNGLNVLNQHCPRSAPSYGCPTS